MTLSLLKESIGIFCGLFLTASTLVAQQIIGPTTVSTGVQYTYTYDDGTVYIGATSWLATTGSIISTSISGSTYTAVVQWTTGGYNTLDFRSKGPTLVAELGVNVCSVAIYTVGGGGTACPGVNLNVTLSGSQVGVNYQRFVDGFPKNTLAGTGSALTWTLSSANPGTHTIVATQTATGCTQNMSGSAVITSPPSPSVYNVTGGGNICTGGNSSVALSSSQSGVNYQLQLNGGNTGSPLAGTGSSLTWGNLTSAGTYTVLATTVSSGCTSTMNNSATISIYPFPTTFSVSGGGPYCTGGSGVSVSLSNSQSGINYQLQIGGANSGSAVAGTGGTLTWSNQTTAGTYTVVANNPSANCSQTMSGTASVSINALPTLYSVGGGGNYCSGSSGVGVTLNGSQSGVNYQLRIGGSNTGSPVAGTGGMLTWTNQTTSGTYTIVATNASTGCTQTMNGSTSVTPTVSPSIFGVIGGGPYCSGGAGDNVRVAGSEVGVDYYLYLNGSNTGNFISGTGALLTWPGVTTAGTYTVVGTSNSTECSATMSSSAVVSVNPLPTAFSMTGGGTYCSGGNGINVTTSGSQTGVNYQLKINGTNSGSPVAGTGGVLTWPNQTTVAGYQATATDATTGCMQTMYGPVYVTTTPLPTQYNLGGGGSYCSGGSGVSVTLSGSQTGVNYQLKANGTNSGSAVAGTGGVLTWTNQTTGGSYTVVATDATTACVQTMSGSSTVTINTVTQYSMGGGGAYCAGGTGLSVTLSSSQTGVNYQLKINGTNSGSPVAGTAGVLTWTNQTTAGSYTVVGTNTTTSCVQTMSGSSTITINTVPTVAITSNQTICSGQAASFTITNPNGISGTTFSWTQNPTNTTGSSNGTGATISQVLSSTNQTTNGTVTYFAMASANGCNSPTSAAMATVKPLPQITSTPAQLLFEGCSVTILNFLPSASISGTAFNWTSSATSGITGNATSGSGTITNTLSNSSHAAAGTATYVITPSLNGCSGTIKNYVVTVDPIPTINVTGSTMLTYGSPTTTLTSTATGNYQWKNNGTNIGVTTVSFVADRTGSISVGVKRLTTSPECVSPPVALTSLIASQSVAVNYVSVSSIMKEGVTATTSLYSLNQKDIAQTIAYQDGIGRTFQTVGVGQSGTQSDLVSPAGFGKNGITDTAAYLAFATSAKDGRFRLNAVHASVNAYKGSEQFQFYQNTANVSHDTVPIARLVHRKSPDARVIEQGAPGKDWQPGTAPGSAHRTVTNKMALNSSITSDSTKVRYWKPDGTTAGNYLDNRVMVSITTDENKNKVRTYTNQLGQTVLKQVQETATSWLETYYVYDQFGRLAYQVSPKATALISGSSFNIASNATTDELVYKYKYDSLGRVKEKKVPGSASQYFVYDQLNRIVLSQDGNLRTNNKWNFIKYDQFGRPIYSGLHTSASSRKALQDSLNAIDYNTQKYYDSLVSGGSMQGYSNGAFPKTGNVLQTVNYYDTYDFDQNGSNDYTYDNTHLAGTPSAASAALRGLPTGNAKLVLGTSTWLKSVVFYDQYDRPIQTQSNNHLNAVVQDKSSILYADLAGHVDRTKMTHTGPTVVTVQQRYTYDPNWRTTGIYHTINGGTEQQVAGYTYNVLGQLIDKKLHVNGGTSLQSIDYRYHIRGWLQSINNAQLSNDSGVTNDDTNDYFGVEMFYNSTEGTSLGNAPSFNGNISAIKWKSAGVATGPTDQRSFKYNYDKSDKLKDATFQAYGTAWTKEANTLDENMTYDANGNIMSLSRKQNQRDLLGITVTSSPQQIDNLTYTYATGNQLSKVTDAATAAGGFSDGSNTAREYNYSTTGSLTADLNKGISSIVYNTLNKPATVTFTDGRVINYTYDASGNKLKATTTVSGVTTTTDYVGGYVYTNNALSFFSSPEGRVVKNGSNYEYQYAITDHQGNTRVLFTSVAATPLATIANFDSDANDQQSQFMNVNQSNVIASTAGNHTSGGSKVVRMNQTYPVGPAISKKVFAGDVVNMEVYSYYEAASGYGTTNAPLTGFITSVATAFGGVNGAPDYTGQIYNGVNSALNQIGTGANPGDAAPAAFLNYILFDKNYKVMTAGWKKVVSTSFAKQYDSIANIKVKEAGYLFAYLSYEDQSNNWVYFDDFKVTVTPTNILQSNEYYAFGLQTANSWTRDNTTANNFLANGGTELNPTSSLYDLEFRNYDPILGRMNQVDPMADKYSSLSTYHYSFNNPVSFNDRNGADPNPGEPDHVTKRGINLFGIANSSGGIGFYGSGLDYGNMNGTATGNIWDNNWQGGYGNVGGIANGNQQLSDYYSMSNGDYMNKYATYTGTGLQGISNALRELGSKAQVTFSTYSVQLKVYDVSKPKGGVNFASSKAMMSLPEGVTSVSQFGIDFIKSWESLRLTAYDANPGTGDWTIGWGHKILPGEDYSGGITLEQANDLFNSDLEAVSINAINQYVNVPLSQEQFDALASYVFNVGAGNSLIGTNLISQLNAGNYYEAGTEMDITMGGGVVLPGLVLRRQAEQDIWNAGMYVSHK